ncbi:hypothetical protein [uncultured Thiocystis sp.]|jgi:hypothetical protein|uniref:hypothetical protein n=1 Tax=uncultured Thiocystis sp. TaxID=1202134 RepID=UPI0025CC3732|nr:hypothetical protein [uncultured Thiocystis sp.]
MRTTQATASDVFADIAGTLEAAEVNASTDWEMELVASLIARYDEYGESLFLSDRQAEILRKLARETR